MGITETRTNGNWFGNTYTGREEASEKKGNSKCDGTHFWVERKGVYF
jgi:hypothetical protein